MKIKEQCKLSISYSRILTKRFERLGAYYKKKGNLFEHQAISAAIENLLLCAEEYRLGAVWLGSPVFLNRGIERIFETNFELCAVVAVGYYDTRPKKTSRLPLSEILEFA